MRSAARALFHLPRAAEITEVAVRRRRVLAFIALCGLWPGVGMAGPPAVLTAPHVGAPFSYADSIAVNASPDEVWRALTDYEHMSEYVPGVVESHVVADSSGTLLLDQVGVSKLWFFHKQVRTRLRLREHDFTRIDFSAVGGDFHVLEGSVFLVPGRGRESTLLKYQMFVRPAFFCPPFLTRFLVMRGLHERLLAVETRVRGRSFHNR